MSRLLKVGLWAVALSVLAFVLTAGGVCGPASHTGEIVAETAIYGGMVGIGICLLTGIWALGRRIF